MIKKRIRYRMAILGERSILYECDDGTTMEEALLIFQRDGETANDFIVDSSGDGLKMSLKETIKDKTSYIVLPRLAVASENIIKVELPIFKKIISV